MPRLVPTAPGSCALKLVGDKAESQVEVTNRPVTCEARCQSEYGNNNTHYDTPENKVVLVNIQALILSLARDPGPRPTG